MLCGTNEYGVAIHYGRRSELKYSLDYSLGNTWYLVGLLSGIGHYNDLSLTAPVALLLPPRTGRLIAAAGADWRLLAFDLMRVPLRTVSESPNCNARTHVNDQPQPGAMAIWGATPPVQVPVSEQQRAMTCLCTCERCWWRGPIDWARANSLLQSWVTNYASREIDESLPDDLPPWLQPILKAMADRLIEGISVAECASLAGMSRQSFHRLFSGAMNETPCDYLQRLRMEEAARLLHNGQHSVAWVSCQVGYRSQAAFSSQFLKFHGCRPGSYRSMTRPASE